MDASSFLGLGGVFSRVVTGNMVLPGVSAAIRDAVAAATGMQASAVRCLGPFSTTYLTGTLTGVVAGLVTRNRPEELGRSLAILSAIIVGAAAGGLVLHAVPRWLPLAVLLPPGLVVVGSAAGFGQVRSHLVSRRHG